MEDEISIQLQTIDEMLDTAREFELETEVIYSALVSMKENPELTPVEALAFGIMEWVK